jgi:membrane-bound ClpP family serine protease
MKSQDRAERQPRIFQSLCSGYGNDPNVKAVVIDVDSPGGSVDGVAELFDQIYSARGSKPITAISNTLMASAAYWIGTAADELVVSPSGQVGSVGVYMVHDDFSKAAGDDWRQADHVHLQPGNTKPKAIPTNPSATKREPRCRRW